jgi:hypothetical protein
MNTMKTRPCSILLWMSVGQLLRSAISKSNDNSWRKVWEKFTKRGETPLNNRKSEIRLRKRHQITFIPAKIVAVDKQSDKHRVIVRILLRKYKGSFHTLMFGENKPLLGACHDGRLDLVYRRDPGLEEGEPFPLWTIQ